MKILKKIKKAVNTYRYYKKRKHFIKTEMAPEKNFKPFELSTTYYQAFEDFKNKGYCYLDLFADTADYLNEEYFMPLIKNQVPGSNIINNVQKPEDLKMGRKIASEVSLLDEKMKSFYFNDQLIKLLYNYYQRQPYLRNYPWIVMHENDESNIKWKDNPVFQGKFHLDQGMHQISYILLINDLTHHDTRLQFAEKSHLDDHYNLDRNSFEDSEIEKKYNIVDCIGPKGRLYIFDAGNGYHRAKYENRSIRKILHLNWTTGHSIIPNYHQDIKNWKWLNDKENYVRRIVNKISA